MPEGRKGYSFRDDWIFNAALNILGQGLPEVKPVEMKALALGDHS